MKNKATVLGLMSGSSLDGLDACLANYSVTNGKWSYEIVDVKTFEISSELKSQLRSSSQLSSKELFELDTTYGKWIAEQIVDLVKHADLISLHGHTVFHEPKKGFSIQIGNAEAISQLTTKPVIAGFRNADIQLGGQGAPLVPMGEKLLFGDVEGFLNLGGICNASIQTKGGIVAGDIGPFNQVFNFYAQQTGAEIDFDGRISAKGKRIDRLEAQWERIAFFSQRFPKSLSNQWVVEHFLAIHDVAPEDVLHSFAHFITDQISRTIDQFGINRVMVTGGGAYHQFGLDLLKSKCKAEIVVPNKELIDYKEALIFGLLGLLRFRGEINVLSSATGARQDSSSGVIFKA
jgi:anhydro-N-acetylmuramic acid kinase